MDDIVAADEVRRRLRAQGVVAMAPDDRICNLLGPGEWLVAVRRAMTFERRVGSCGRADGLDADLYVTNRRLVLLGRVRIDYSLSEIREIDVGPGVVRIVVGGSHGVDLRVRDPRVLRVEISAAREAGSATTTSRLDPGAGQGSLR